MYAALHMRTCSEKTKFLEKISYPTEGFHIQLCTMAPTFAKESMKERVLVKTQAWIIVNFDQLEYRGSIDDN